MLPPALHAHLPDIAPSHLPIYVHASISISMWLAPAQAVSMFVPHVPPLPHVQLATVQP